MLGGRGIVGGGAGNAAKGDDKSPTHRLPGTSVAAKACTAASSGSWADAARRAEQGGSVSPPSAAGDKGRIVAGAGNGGPIVDADGFQKVTGRFRRKDGPAGTTSADGGTVREADVQLQGDEGPQANAGATTASGGEGTEGEHGEQPTADELQRAWLEEVALVKKLRHQGIQGTHPAMLAACEARDAAERAWRGSKEPAPPAVRLGRAQQKLDRAIALQSEARQAILDAEKAHRDKMAVLQSTMDDCTERVRLRRGQLREVQEEVGSGGTGDGGGQRAHQQEAIRRVHDSICSDIGPTIAALVEQLDTEAPAWAALNGVLGKLSASKDALEGACAPRAAPQYDIGDGDQDHWESWSQWSESHDMQGKAWGGRRGGCDDDGGEPRADGQRSAGVDMGMDGDEGAQDQSMGTDDWWDAPAHRWPESSRWQSYGHGKWTRSSWADQLEHERGGHGDEDDEGDGQPAAARRRLEDRGVAQPKEGMPQPPQHGPKQVGASGSHAGSIDQEEQKRLHNERLNAIISMAVDAGVNPLTQSGEELQLLDPHQLDAWVAENLPSALLC